jgi:hypothetical protein
VLARKVLLGLLGPKVLKVPLGKLGPLGPLGQQVQLVLPAQTQRWAT